MVCHEGEVAILDAAARFLSANSDLNHHLKDLGRLALGLHVSELLRQMEPHLQTLNSTLAERRMGTSSAVKQTARNQGKKGTDVASHMPDAHYSEVAEVRKQVGNSDDAHPVEEVPSMGSQTLRKNNGVADPKLIPVSNASNDSMAVGTRDLTMQDVSLGYLGDHAPDRSKNAAADTLVKAEVPPAAEASGVILSSDPMETGDQLVTPTRMERSNELEEDPQSMSLGPSILPPVCFQNGIEQQASKIAEIADPNQSTAHFGRSSLVSTSENGNAAVIPSSPRVDQSNLNREQSAAFPNRSCTQPASMPQKSSTAADAATAIAPVGATESAEGYPGKQAQVPSLSPPRIAAENNALLQKGSGILKSSADQASQHGNITQKDVISNPENSIDLDVKKSIAEVDATTNCEKADNHPGSRPSPLPLNFVRQLAGATAGTESSEPKNFSTDRTKASRQDHIETCLQSAFWLYVDRCALDDWQRSIKGAVDEAIKESHNYEQPYTRSISILVGADIFRFLSHCYVLWLQQYGSVEKFKELLGRLRRKHRVGTKSTPEPLQEVSVLLCDCCLAKLTDTISTQIRLLQETPVICLCSSKPDSVHAVGVSPTESRKHDLKGNNDSHTMVTPANGAAQSLTPPPAAAQPNPSVEQVNPVYLQRVTDLLTAVLDLHRLCVQQLPSSGVLA